MARPTRCRRICMEPDYDSFAPCGAVDGAAVILSVDEFEVIRLIDFDKLTHEACAKQMQVSRTTVTEMYERARYKLADSLVNGRPLRIMGGNYKVCEGGASCPNSNCWRQSAAAVQSKGDNTMRIAVTYENEMIFQHFGHSEQFKLYDVQDGAVVSEQVVPTMGSGHGALAGFLVGHQVDVLICGGIGPGAQNALASEGIKLYAGISGSADEAVKALLAGTLAYHPEANCDHHDHAHGEGHSCGEHGCGEHSCGEHGCH